MTDDPHQWPGELPLALQDALDAVEPHAGAPKPPGPAPPEVHWHHTEACGLIPHHPPTPDGGQSGPDLPHSAEQKEEPMDDVTTPQARADAWLKLMTGLERSLVATKANAQAVVAINRDWPGMDDVPAYQATTWAASKLLAQLRGLEVPEVPVDHTLGQPTLDEGTYPLIQVDGDALSTPVDEPGDNHHVCHNADHWPSSQPCGWDGCPLKGATDGKALCFLRAAREGDR